MEIRQRIKTIRGVQVMLDWDIAELYGVETRSLNQAVKRNMERFPPNFRFQLTKAVLRSPTAIVALRHAFLSSAGILQRLGNVEVKQIETDKTYVHIEATEERQGVKIIAIAIQTEGGQSQFEATFASTKGASYTLLRSEDLTKPIDQWEPIATKQAPGENFMLADPNPPAEKAFYMVVTGAVGK